MPLKVFLFIYACMYFKKMDMKNTEIELSLKITWFFAVYCESLTMSFTTNGSRK